jgi:cytochrome o ubiquinol oxidase operon protein cyoD
MSKGIRAYIIGFILSILLTVESYLLVVSHNFSSGMIMAIIVILAVVQLMVQLFFFLHLDRMVKAPWNFIMFITTAIIVGMIVFGSIWIMAHLDYSHDHSAEKNTQYLQDNEDL